MEPEPEPEPETLDSMRLKLEWAVARGDVDGFRTATAWRSRGRLWVDPRSFEFAYPGQSPLLTAYKSGSLQMFQEALAWRGPGGQFLNPREGLACIVLQVVKDGNTEALQCLRTWVMVIGHVRGALRIAQLIPVALTGKCAGQGLPSANPSVLDARLRTLQVLIEWADALQYSERVIPDLVPHLYEHTTQEHEQFLVRAFSMLLDARYVDWWFALYRVREPLICYCVVRDMKKLLRCLLNWRSVDGLVMDFFFERVMYSILTSKKDAGVGALKALLKGKYPYGQSVVRDHSLQNVRDWPLLNAQWPAGARVYELEVARRHGWSRLRRAWTSAVVRSSAAAAMRSFAAVAMQKMQKM